MLLPVFVFFEHSTGWVTSMFNGLSKAAVPATRSPSVAVMEKKRMMWYSLWWTGVIKYPRLNGCWSGVSEYSKLSKLSVPAALGIVRF